MALLYCTDVLSFLSDRQNKVSTLGYLINFLSTLLAEELIENFLIQQSLYKLTFFDLNEYDNESCYVHYLNIHSNTFFFNRWL